MQYKVAIVDQEAAETLVSQELKTAQGSIRLSYNGSDSIIQDIVASTFTFSLLETTNDALAFSDLFTSKENRFRVDVSEVVSETIIWQGFLLPDSYQEEYKKAPLFVGFSALCGLGLLKGKYFDASYYLEEQSVIDVLSKCFAATGLTIDFSFSPGIENTTEKDFTQIYIDMLDYYDDEKNTYSSIYEVLQEVLQSLQSVCFQENNQWHVLGINKRFLKEYETKLYTTSGVLQSTETITRKIVVANALATPLLTLQPALKEAVITRDLQTFEIPEETYKLPNKGYVAEIEQNETLFAGKWMQNNNINAIANYKDLKVYLPYLNDATQTYYSNRYITLREKIGVRYRQKIQINLKFKALTTTDNNKAIEDSIANGDLTNPIYYDVLLNNQIYFSNLSGTRRTTNTTLQFNKDLEAEAFYSFVVPESGVLDVKIYQPYYTTETSIFDGFEFLEFTAENLAEVEDSETFVCAINNDFTQVEEFELPIADDVSGINKAFLTVKNRELALTYETQTINVQHSFTVNSKHYTVVTLFDAMMVDQYRTTLYNSASLVTVNDVIYNYEGGEQMCIETDTLIASGTDLDLRIYPYKTNIDAREYSETWSDAVYKVESDRFIEAFGKVIKRLHASSLLTIDATYQKKIGFNDLVYLFYESARNFIPTNITWDLAFGTTTFRGIEAFYNAGSTVQIPPTVNAGATVFIANADTTANLSATASDPDGAIATVLWEQVSPVSPVVTFDDASILTPALSNVSADVYTFQVTVTDNDGLQAVDTVQVIRDKEYTLSLTEIATSTSASDPDQEQRTYRVASTPALVEGTTVTLNFENIATTSIGGPTAYAIGKVKIIKNGQVLRETLARDDESLTEFLVASYIEGDVIDIEMLAEGWYDEPSTPETYDALATLKLNSATVTGATATVIGLPLTQTIQVN